LSENDPSGPSTGSPFVWLASMAFFAVAFVAYASAFRGPSGVLFGFLCLIAGGFAASFVHECGHGLAAHLCRWRIILFVVRPFGLQIGNRDLAFVPRDYNDGAGGWVAMVPRRPGADTRLNWAIILAAGPLASLLLAALAFFASASTAPYHAAPSVIVANLWLGFAVQALHGGLFSLTPFGGRRTSDGAQLRALWRGDPEEYALRRSAKWTITLTAHRVRLRDLPEWMMAELRTSAGRSEEIAQHLAAVEIGRQLDSPPFDVPMLRASLDAFRKRYETSDWLASSDAWLAATWEDDLERAETALAAVGSPSQVPALTLAAEAALAARLGVAGAVHTKLAEMRQAIRKETPFRDDTFRDIQAQIETLLTQAPEISPARP